MRHQRFAAAILALLASACGGSTATAPLSPPPDSLALVFRDTVTAGEMTWVDVVQPATDTGAITIETSDASTLAVDPDGRVFPFKSGTVTITARSANLVGVKTIQIATRPDSFRIAFRFRWSPTAAERSLFDRAALRWQRVLRQAAPTTTGFPAGACLAGTAAESMHQQGVVVFVDRFDDAQVASSVTGTAGQCVFDELGMTRVGVMTLRQSFSAGIADLSAPERAAWENQFTRQLGQTLGLVGLTAFGVERPELDLSAPSTPRWNGPLALAAYRSAGGAAAGIPITADLNFWRASDPALAGDVMLPAISGTSRISPITLGALGDRGYTTVPTRAEPAPATAAPMAALTSEAWHGTRWLARHDGRTTSLGRR